MNIAIIGATGKAGQMIMNEALSRGHSVTAIVRDKRKLTNSKVNVLEKNLFNLTTKDLASFDVVIDAFNAPQGQEQQHQTSLAHLIEILHGQKTRLLVVGGAGSLYVDDALTLRVCDTPDFPEAYKATALNMAEGFKKLKASNDINWTYLSPSAFFNPQGKRTGAYQMGKDKLMVNSAGESTISYADYAIAMIDEAENATHNKQRFTVVAGTE